jgi:hypothetical protein
VSWHRGQIERILDMPGTRGVQVFLVDWAESKVVKADGKEIIQGRI